MMGISRKESITDLKDNFNEFTQNYIDDSDKTFEKSTSLYESLDKTWVLQNSQLKNADVKGNCNAKDDKLHVSNNESSDLLGNLNKTDVTEVINNCKQKADSQESTDEVESTGIDASSIIKPISDSSPNVDEITEKDKLNDLGINKCEIEITQEIIPEKKNLDDYRCESDNWSDDDDSSSSSSDTSSDSDFFQRIVESSSTPKSTPGIKTKGELELDDLPPIEDLIITIPEKDMMLIGKVHAVVDKLVVVHAVKDMKPLDLDSVLFLTHNKPLGRVYDVFGPVVEPYYCIRFNSVEDINKKFIEIGADVFFAPEKDDITSYVFVADLQQKKGSDASWKFNNEPPEEFLDFSDDEQEKAAKRKRMIEKRNRKNSNFYEFAAKRPSLMNDYNTQENWKQRPKSYLFPSPRSNTNVSAPSRFNSYSSLYSRPPPSPSPSVSVIEVSRFTPYQSPSPVPSDSSVFVAPLLSSSYPPPLPSPAPSVSSVFAAPIFAPVSRPYPPSPLPSPAPSVSSVFIASRYPPPPSPSVSSVLAAPKFIPFSSSYTHPPPSPLSSISRFTSFSNPYPYPPPPSVSVSATSSSFSNPYPFRLPSPTPSISVDETPSSFSNIYTSCPPSPTPSVCSEVSVIMRAQRPSNFFTPRQPRTSFPRYQRPFSQQDAPQRFTAPSTVGHSYALRASSPQQYHLSGNFSPQNAMQMPALSPLNVVQNSSIPQRSLPSALPSYQQTHVFGQVSLISPLPFPITAPPPPPPPVSVSKFISQPTTPTNYFSNVNSHGPPYHSPNASTHVPPHHPLKIEIPNLNDSSVPINQWQDNQHYIN